MYVALLNYDRFFKKIFSDEKIAHIEDEKKTWEEVERLERGIYEDGKKDGEKIGIEKGEKIGIEKGREGIALNMIKHGMDIESIAQITGLSHSKLEEIVKKGE
ncbi:MAG TPA: hypothetical protein VK469_19885 [Candidatus Kapabacteria bacterium]|nr:hypothetical protein [Candidatus Kapabacteria bacterium]